MFYKLVSIFSCPLFSFGFRSIWLSSIVDLNNFELGQKKKKIKFGVHACKSLAVMKILKHW
jgi:hypothetical protein